MIDKFVYWFFGKLDNISYKLDTVFTFNFPKAKKKIKNVKSPDNRMDFPLE